MANGRAIGGNILVASIVGIIAYGGLLYLLWSGEWTIRITAFLGVGLLLAILAWIGYTKATTPPRNGATKPLGQYPELKAEK